MKLLVKRLSTLLIVAVLLLAVPAPAGAAGVLVFAAASTSAPVGEIVELFKTKGQGSAAASFASSSVLAKQIFHGAPADIYISANPQWMDYLSDEKSIEPSTRFDLLANRLVLVAPADSALSVQIGDSFPLSDKLGGGKLAMGDPDHVPAGIYGKAALENLGVWRSVSGQVVMSQDVRAALALVERGEAAAGVVYATDAAMTKNVRVVSGFPAASHPPIIYPAAIVAGRDRPQVRGFFQLLKSPAAADIFSKYGFTLIGAEGR